MTSSIAKVKVCPFCGHHGQYLNVQSRTVELPPEEEGRFNREVNHLFTVRCRSCGAVGPEEIDPFWAIDSWNNRHSRPAHSNDPEEVEMSFSYDENYVGTKYAEGMKNNNG